jgi:hypothetical protein
MDTMGHNALLMHQPISLYVSPYVLELGVYFQCRLAFRTYDLGHVTSLIHLRKADQVLLPDRAKPWSTTGLYSGVDELGI